MDSTPSLVNKSMPASAAALLIDSGTDSLTLVSTLKESGKKFLEGVLIESELGSSV